MIIVSWFLIKCKFYTLCCTLKVFNDNKRRIRNKVLHNTFITHVQSERLLSFVYFLCVRKNTIIFPALFKTSLYINSTIKYFFR